MAVTFRLDRRAWTLAAAWLLAGIVLPLCATTPAAGAAKKLIQSGWGEPDPAFMRLHIREMEQSPFDGCVFSIKYRRPGGAERNFTWDCWSDVAFTLDDLRPALDDLRATRFERFTHNFLRFNVTPGNVDWFDDFSPILGNARLAATIARQGRCKGILFDLEPYHQQIYHYARQRYAGTRSWEDYAAQARLRGRQVMQAFQQGYPGITVFLTYGYSLMAIEMNLKLPLPDSRFGLMVPFLDGMIDGAQPPARIIDGFENAYGYRDTTRFDVGRRDVKRNLLQIVGPKQKYPRVYSLAFGIWMDYDWQKNGWNTERFSGNYYSPAAFERTVRKALRTTDEYVWIYSETPRWWSESGKPVKLPKAYDAALRRARAGQ